MKRSAGLLALIRTNSAVKIRKENEADGVAMEGEGPWRQLREITKRQTQRHFQFFLPSVDAWPPKEHRHAPALSEQSLGFFQLEYLFVCFFLYENLSSWFWWFTWHGSIDVNKTRSSASLLICCHFFFNCFCCCCLTGVAIARSTRISTGVESVSEAAV